jgi:hypothetical protein
MKITITERCSYDGDKSIFIYTTENTEVGREKYASRKLIFKQYFNTGYKRDEKTQKIANRSYDRCMDVLTNKRVAESCLEDYDPVVAECAKIRMEYAKNYFQKEKD